jgi:hypothetical protein
MRSCRVVADPDPGTGSGMGKNPDPGYRMNNPDHISKSLKQFFRLKILKFSDLGSFRPWIRDGKNRIRDPE